MSYCDSSSVWRLELSYRRFWLILLLPILAFGAYHLRGVIEIYLITPVIYALRVEKILYETIPQIIYWIVFITILIIIAVNSLFSKRRPAPMTTPLVENRATRARQLSYWIKAAKRSDYSRWMLARNLAGLALNLIADQERFSTEEAEKFIRRGRVNMPADVRKFVLAGLEVPSFRHYVELKKLQSGSYHDFSLDLDPEIIVNYLESQAKSGGFG
jgi:hypothetical protein